MLAIDARYPPDNQCSGAAEAGFYRLCVCDETVD
jgi:hypothetical protein